MYQVVNSNFNLYACLPFVQRGGSLSSPLFTSLFMSVSTFPPSNLLHVIRYQYLVLLFSADYFRILPFKCVVPGTWYEICVPIVICTRYLVRMTRGSYISQCLPDRLVHAYENIIINNMIGCLVCVNNIFNG